MTSVRKCLRPGPLTLGGSGALNSQAPLVTTVAARAVTIGKRLPKIDAEVRQYLLEKWEELDLGDFRKYREHA